MDPDNLINTEGLPAVKPYPIELPGIPSGAVYLFRTDSGVDYEVRFGRRQDHCLEHIINFGVLNDEFEHEYVVTNRGEIYRVIATVIEIIRLYHAEHPHSTSYEFTGEFKQGEKETSSIRSRLYLRIAGRVLLPNWKAMLVGNKVVVSRISK